MGRGSPRTLLSTWSWLLRVPQGLSGLLSGGICHQGAAASLEGTSQENAGGLKLAMGSATASRRRGSASVSQKTARVRGWGAWAPTQQGFPHLPEPQGAREEVSGRQVEPKRPSFPLGLSSANLCRQGAGSGPLLRAFGSKFYDKDWAERLVLWPNSSMPAWIVAVWGLGCNHGTVQLGPHPPSQTFTPPPLCFF